MFCNKCGTQFPDNAMFCPSCGNSISKSLSPQPKKVVSKNSAIKKSPKKLIIILSIIFGLLLLISGGLIAYGMVTGNFFSSESAQEQTTVSEQKPEQTSDQDWEDAKLAYFNKISGTKFPSGCKFIFIDINGDNILELYMQGPDYATGDMLWTYYNGNVFDLKVPNYGLSYFEGQNYFLTQQMHMGSGCDNIMSIEDGNFLNHHKGQWTQADPYSKITEKYVFDGESVDQKTYESELKNLFDYDKAKRLSNNDTGWMSVDQLKKTINNSKSQSHYY